MTDEQPKKGRGGRRPNQTGRPPSPPERKARWAKTLPLRVSPELHAAYHTADAATQARARAAMIDALRAALAAD